MAQTIDFLHLAGYKLNYGDNYDSSSILPYMEVLLYIFFINRVVFFSLVPPDFSTKKKTANQPIRAAVLINLFTKKGHDWLLGGFSFWY